MFLNEVFEGSYPLFLERSLALHWLPMTRSRKKKDDLSLAKDDGISLAKIQRHVVAPPVCHAQANKPNPAFIELYGPAREDAANGTRPSHADNVTSTAPRLISLQPLKISAAAPVAH